MVLLSELLAEESGVVWLGEVKSECALVHGKKEEGSSTEEVLLRKCCWEVLLREEP